MADSASFAEGRPQTNEKRKTRAKHQNDPERCYGAPHLHTVVIVDHSPK